MKKNRRTMSLVGAAFLAGGFLLPAGAHAGSLTPEMENLEALKQSQGAVASLIARVYGADNTVVLSFTSTHDLTGGTASFSLQGGTLYLGETLVVSGSGTFNSSTNKWDLSSTVQLGGRAPILGGGVANFLVTPKEVDWVWGPLDYHTKITYQITEYAFGSTLTATFTFNGAVVLSGVAGRDFGTPGGHWRWKMTAPGNDPFRIESEGTADVTAGNGSFTVFITDQPEIPAVSEWGLVVTALLLLTSGTIVCVRRRAPA